MKSTNRLVLIATLAAVAACGAPTQVPSPASPSATVASAPALPSSSAPAVAAAPRIPPRSIYLNADGEVNYDALRKTYGEPNQNLVYNTKAVNVLETTSRGHVTVQPNQLLFPSATSKWLLSKHAGDVLVCDDRCDAPFLRRIVMVKQLGDQILVKTVNGSISDVMTNGWVHIEVPVIIRVTSEGTQVQPVYTPQLSGSYSGKLTIPSFSITKEIPFDETVKMEASVSEEFATTLKLDVATSWTTVTLFSYKQDFTNTFKISAGIKASGTLAETKKQILDQDQTVATFVIPIGPVTIPVKVDAKAKAWVGAKADGEVEVSGEYEKVSTATVGFKYTDKDGFSKQEPAEEEPGTASVVAKGKVGAKAYIEVDPGVSLLLFGAAGPEFDLALEGGVEASITDQVSPTCKVQLKADFYAQISAKCKAEVSIGIDWSFVHVHWEKDLGEFDFKIVSKFTSPNPPFTIDVSKYVCPATPDGGSSTSSTSSTSSSTTSSGGTSTTGTTTGGSSGTSTGGSTGTTSSGGSSGGGSTGGSNACASDNDCWTLTGNAAEICVGGSCCDSTDPACVPPGGGPCSSDADCTNQNQTCCNGTCSDTACGLCGDTCASYMCDPTSTCSGGTCSCTCPDGSNCGDSEIGALSCALPPSTCPSP